MMIPTNRTGPWLMRVELFDLFQDLDEDKPMNSRDQRDLVAPRAAEVAARVLAVVPEQHRDDDLESTLLAIESCDSVHDLIVELGGLYDWGDLGKRLLVNAVSPPRVEVAT